MRLSKIVKSSFIFSPKGIRPFVITIGAVPAAAFAAITAAQQILFGKNNVTFRSFVEIAFLEFFGIHNYGT